MIPNLTLIVASYVILRCFEIALQRQDRFQGATGYWIMALASLGVAGITALALLETISAGVGIDVPPAFR